MSKPKDKILSALEEIRDLVEKNCGETKEAVREAVVETIATLSPQLMLNKPATFANAIVNPNLEANQPPVFINQKPKTTNAVCPGGPATWNQFQKMYKETHADELKGIPYSEVRKIISSAYRQTACGPSVEAKLKTRRAVKTNKPRMNGNTAVPSIKKTRVRKPKTLAPVVQTLPTVQPSSTFRLNEGEYRTLINHQQNAQKTLQAIQEEVPELAGNINSTQRLINSQEQILKKLNTTSPTQQTMYNRTLTTAQQTKEIINDKLETLRTRANNSIQTRKVRIMAPNNSQARTPGSSTLSSNNSSTLSSANTVQSKNNANKTSNLEFEGPVENNGTRKARINGKRYFYWENNEGKHLLERLNNNSPGNDFGFYNKNAPGYFRPAPK
jgi:hypothetical protein